MLVNFKSLYDHRKKYKSPGIIFKLIFISRLSNFQITEKRVTGAFERREKLSFNHYSSRDTLYRREKKD